ncbi:LptA/OstA family protein [Aliikangiella marina]|nr:LptA/OstA family protein [Aliikangiella marina]
MNSNLKCNSLLGLMMLLVTLPAHSQETRKITGDSSSWDIANNQMKYFGNAVLTFQNLTLKGDQLIAMRDPQSKRETIIVNGQPASFEDTNQAQQLSTNLQALNIEYQSETILASQNVHIKQVNERQETIDIKGDKLSWKQSTDFSLSVSGSPLEVAIMQADKSSISAKANQLIYNKQSELFELIGDVIVNSERETLRAEKVIYNMKTRILQVPKSDKRQVEIIQSKANK